ncbi:helix-turn-helix domain-containing protein [Flavobacterium terrisoli]|uniref:helix-turn-helix domain-containing protein n=1 Tax=Flavobacterium terrisoli TaxID=3242195 RepID=UPI002542B92E|nr:helix-turn-helix transcriptional regulator [Flavobacterium buctense]
MKKDTKIARFDSLSELNKVLGLPKPLHPLVNLANYADITTPFDEQPETFQLNFYKISYKFNLSGKIGYGQNSYDFAEGRMAFIAPNQILSRGSADQDVSGHTLLIHPDFIRNYPLGKKIKTFGFFSYSANEALYISEKEKQTIFSVFENIKAELSNNIDDFSQDVLIAHFEVLLHYSNRFYKRQFITRKAVNHDLLTKMESLLDTHFEHETSSQEGLPTVELLADHLNVSPRYLSDMLRSLTGQNAQQHIHDKLIEKAKEYLSTTSWSVSEIAYRLGFEHSQSFSRLFKKKTKLTPIEFKNSLN